MILTEEEVAGLRAQLQPGGAGLHCGDARTLAESHEEMRALLNGAAAVLELVVDGYVDSTAKRRALRAAFAHLMVQR
jgi:hypothetical protein